MGKGIRKTKNCHFLISSGASPEWQLMIGPKGDKSVNKKRIMDFQCVKTTNNDDFCLDL